MPDDVTRDLRALTPVAPDRDAILFAAGRGARRWAGWKWLTFALVVLNSVTLAVLVWPKPAVSPPPAALEPPPAAVEPVEPSRPDPHSYIALQRGWDTPSVESDTRPMPAEPPLTPRSIHDFQSP
jgi:hypothetical protein